MSFKIDMGMFHTDSNRDFWGRALQLVSRFTWESLQSTFGYLYSNFRNLNQDVDRVDYFGGATFITKENASKQNGVSLGNFININNREEIPTNISFEQYILTAPLYMHEYGHTFQSERYGIGYLFGIGVSSLLSAGSDNHKTQPYEKQANRWSRRYFDKYYHGRVDWTQYQNPEGYPYYPLN